MFTPDDKVTTVFNTQCHGVVLESDETYTNVKLDNFSSNVVFRTSELKLRETKNE
jgi:hypothetical protein